MVSLEEIKSFFKGKILINELLSEHTSFKIGGPADYYFEPLDKNDLITLVSYFHKINFPFYLIGNGSNLLINDAGLRGAVISLENSLNDKKFENGLIYGGAGLKLSKFVDFCIQNSKKGIEMLAGIPGSLGGALVMNASAYGGSISDYLYDVEVYHLDQVKRLKKEDIRFAYRYSELNEMIILEARFELPDGDKDEISIIRKELLDYRKAAQPVNYPCAGCVFKNPPGYHAAVLVQESNLKGLRIGGAEISDLHGNFIINIGNAKAQDVITLIKTAMRRIKEEKNIDLELEIKLIGFPENPLKIEIL
jgi:UDP-N-acetylmuramate dehydrogenase